MSATCSAIECQVEKALRFAADWQGIEGDISVELNRDFFPPTFTGADLSAWVAARQSGEISKETFFAVLKYSEWIKDDRSFEEEQEAISNDGPVLIEIYRLMIVATYLSDIFRSLSRRNVLLLKLTD